MNGNDVIMVYTLLLHFDYNDNVQSTSSNRIVIKAINNLISEQRITEWLHRIGRIDKIETCFVEWCVPSEIASESIIDHLTVLLS